MITFDMALASVIGHEGGFSRDAADPGNWTGGRRGAGELRGTKFGISASAYPDLDIAALSIDAARLIYRRDYWQPIRADSLPGGLALLLFDAAVNSGVEQASRWLQQAVDADIDGHVGPQTVDLVNRATEKPGGAEALCAEVLARRIVFMASLPTWRLFGLGWSRRICRLPYEAASLN